MLTKKELEELRPWVNNQVAALLGFPESAVVNTALDCIGKSLNRQATTGGRLKLYLMHFIMVANRAPFFVLGKRCTVVCGVIIQEGVGGERYILEIGFRNCKLAEHSYRLSQRS